MEEERTNTRIQREMHAQKKKWWLHGSYFPNRDQVALNYPDNLHESTAF